MTHHPAHSGPDQLLHCSLERTVVRTVDPVTGQPEVVKVLLRGSLVDAERELDFGRRVEDLGVAAHLSAGLDPQSGRPCLRTAWHAGPDLAALIAQRGAVDGATACMLLLPVAQTLTALHARRAVDAPQGLVHGDVKPSNLLRTETTTLLLDFEHAGPAGAGRCAGTPGFAAPEAAAGARLAPAFDVFGLGATLHWLLAGTPPRRGALAAQDPELQLLVAACTAAQATARPVVATVARKLGELAQRLRTEPAEAARTALLAGDLDAARTALTAPGIGAGTRELLQALLVRRQRLLDRCPGLAATLTAPLDADEGDVDAITARLRRLTSFLRRFPAHAEAAAARGATMAEASRALHAALPQLAELTRSEDFAAARAQLARLEALARAALASPGQLRIPDGHDPRMPTLLQRSPLQCLQQEAQRITAAAADSDRIAATLAEAESRLALDEAEAIVDRIATHHGGTAGAVTRRRDRLHRLGFYLERIGRAGTNLQRLRELLPTADLRPLSAFVDDCAAAAARATAHEELAPGAMGLRQLQLTLANLSDEFPALGARVRPGLDCLGSALATVTDEAWQLLADAQHKLQAEPVPVRPLQMLLGRLDTFRVLEALIDRPQRQRSQLIDRIEALRLRLEQAQATRDRLARGAEQALAKGHWTTGLFDMERAVTSLETEDIELDQEAARLRQRLVEAKKRKQEIEHAQRRNVELEGRYEALLAEGRSPAERLLALRERHDCLQFLAVHSQKDRGRLYARDLRAVELRIASEQAQQAEHAFAATTDLDERLRLARQTLSQIDVLAGDGSAQPDDVHELATRWQQRLAAALVEVQTRAQRATSRVQRRQRLLSTALVLLLASAVGGLFFLRPTPVSAQESLRAFAVTRLAGADVASALAPALQALRELGAGDPHAARAVDLLATGERAANFADWQRDLAVELGGASVPLAFAQPCWRLAVALAAQRCPAEQLPALRAAVADANARLAPRGIAPAADAQRLLDAR